MTFCSSTNRLKGLAYAYQQLSLALYLSIDLLDCVLIAEQEWELEYDNLPSFFDEFRGDETMRKRLPPQLYGAIKRVQVHYTQLAPSRKYVVCTVAISFPLINHRWHSHGGARMNR